jgi:hypothetical protein
MRITRDALLKVVQDTVAQRVRADRSLVAAYLCGSILEEEFLLGGTTDIDLIFIHIDPITPEREIVSLTDEVHLDVAHHLNRDYRQPRLLRIHPWLGPTLKGCKILYDPQHFLDFTQASVRGQYERPDHILERARGQFEAARQTWKEIHLTRAVQRPDDLLVYLRALAQAANAVALLTGAPLPERRFLLNFQARSNAVGRPGLFPGILGLLGSPRVEPEIIKSWFPLWQTTFQAVPTDQAPARLHSARLSYYRRGFEAIASGAYPAAVLWPLLRTWTLAATFLPPASPGWAAWSEAVRSLGLYGEDFTERVQALDAYLDLIDETLDEWARRSGAQTG